jgi:TrmH family RNA methyltransferase
VTDTVSPQPVLAVAAQADVPLAELEGAEPLVVCVDVRDPGNLGTVLRTAEAAGAAGVICCDGTVDVYNPKCVRASAGSVFHVRLVAGGDPVEVLERVRTWGVRRLGTAARVGTPYHEVDFKAPGALVVGNEAHGLPESVAGAIDEWVTIPMAGRAESLNVGMATAVLCFEAARQRASHSVRARSR